MTAYIIVSLILHVIGALNMLASKSGAPRAPLTEGVIRSVLLINTAFIAWAALLLWS